MAKEQEKVTYLVVDQKEEVVYEGDSRPMAVKAYAQPHAKKWSEKKDGENQFTTKSRKPDEGEIGWRPNETRKWL